MSQLYHTKRKSFNTFSQKHTQKIIRKAVSHIERSPVLCYNTLTSLGLNLFFGECFLKNTNTLEIVFVAAGLTA